MARAKSVDRDNSSIALRRPPGFTLVEMLVTVAILGILASLLIAAIAGARSQGDKMACLNNSRQLVAAWLMYAADFKDMLLPNVDGLLGGFTNWVAGNMKEAEEAQDADLLLDSRRTLMAAYIQSSRVYKCPADDSMNVRSVAMNCRLNPTRAVGEPRWVGGQGSAFQTFFRLTDIATPGHIFVIIDESEITINDAYFAVDMSNTGSPYGIGVRQPYYLIDFPASRHGRSATLSFADGHAVPQRWKHQATFRQTGPVQYVGESPDARWIQEHCTYLRE